MPIINPFGGGGEGSAVANPGGFAYDEDGDLAFHTPLVFFALLGVGILVLVRWAGFATAISAKVAIGE